MLKHYEIVILEKLLGKYERSKASKEGSKRNLTISLSFDEKNMPDYVNENSYQYELEIEEAVNNLYKLGIIEIKYDFDKRVKKVNLLIENVDKCYKLLNKKSLKEKRDDVQFILSKYKDKGDLTSWYIDKINKRILNYKSTISYFKSVRNLEEILYVLEKLEKQKEEISIRNFSAKYLKNSKRMEMILPKIEKIIQEYLGTDDEVLSKFNVYRNPTFVYLKGIGKFKINNQIINLTKLQSELILSSHHIKSLQVLSLDCNEIVTVENLTTFYDYPMGRRCIIYLGGFHNEIRKNLLCKLYDFNKKMPFYHSGDIDAGGFYILNHLIKDTKIPFKARDMGVDVLEKFRDYTINLSTEDRKRVSQLLDIAELKEYYPVFLYMLDNDMKLEQENIKYI